MARRGSPTPNLRDGRSTREAVLDVAEHHFAERGFAGVSMREIAAEAGLRNQASLYNHFASKQALYEAVLGRGLAPIVKLMVESRRAGAPAADVERFVDHTLEYLAAHPDLPRLIQRAALEEGEGLRTVVSGLLRPAFAEGLTALAASAAGHRAEELPYLALGLYHLIFGYFANAQLLELVGQSDPLGPEALARQRAFVKDAVTRLLGRASRLRLAPRNRGRDEP
jgi:AcrR family transcriptional regulator